MNEKSKTDIVFQEIAKGHFIYNTPKFCEPRAQNATLAVKMAQRTVFLDPWYIVGGTKWSRFRYRLKHPIIYSKRGLLGIFRKIKRLFVKERLIKLLPQNQKERSQ